MQSWRKRTALPLIFLGVFSAGDVRAANIVWAQAANLALAGSSITLVVDAGSEADSLTVGSSSFTVSVASGQVFTVRYPGPSYGTMTNDGAINECSIVGSDNVVVVNGPKTVTFTPITTTCVEAVPVRTGSGSVQPPSVRVYAPNGGEKVKSGSLQRVFWMYGGSQGRSMTLQLSVNGGDFKTAATNLALSGGFHDLALPELASDATAIVRAQLIGDGDAVLSYDDSDGVFTIEGSSLAERTEPSEKAADAPESYDPKATIDGDKVLPENNEGLGSFCLEKKLIKLADDGNPETQHDSAVYYCGRDGKRYGFPNAKIYATWYEDFSSVTVIAPEAMAALPLGGNVTYRPGSRLVKIQSDPKVYAVGRDGLLRHVPDEATAAALFGNSWSSLVDDIDVAFFSNYRFGSPVPRATP